MNITILVQVHVKALTSQIAALFLKNMEALGTVSLILESTNLYPMEQNVSGSALARVPTTTCRGQQGASVRR